MNDPTIPDNPNVAIVTQKLTKRFGDLTAVKGLDLSVRQGEIFGLLGPNGAGKTTTISMLATLLEPTSGSAGVNGFDIARQSLKVRQSIGIVFQDPSSDDILTGYENLYLHAIMYGVPRAERGARIEEVLRLVGLKERAGDIVRTYSGGMRRRLELGRGLLHEPQVLFLDEPTLGLDPQTREHIWDYIESIVKGQQVTIILTTHYMEEAERLCDRVAIIDHGEIVVLDTPAALKEGIGGESIRLKVAQIDEASGPTGAHLESVARELRRLPFVSSVNLLDDELKIAVMGVEALDRLPELLEITGKVVKLNVHSTTLNDVFLHYCGRDIRAESAEKRMEVAHQIMHRGGK